MSCIRNILRSSGVAIVFALTMACHFAVPGKSSPDTAILDLPQLAHSHPCAGKAGFTCSMLNIPLDYRHPARETLRLQVATADNTDAPRGVLLFLVGGPGQPGVPTIARLKERMPDVAKDYRFVAIDQRGTGEFGAIHCPALEAQIGGGSDIATPTPDAVLECATLLGDKAALYSTDDTVADIDRLRRALGVETMVVDGISYGTYTAAHYAIAHPRNVRKLVLDSVAPYQNAAEYSLYLAALRASGRILREACAAAPACDFDPAEDLATLVRRRDTAAGVRLFDTLVSYEFVDPTYRNANPPSFPAGQGDIVSALHSARNGDPAHLSQLEAIFKPGEGKIATFSMGLHAATICADRRFPWGDAATPVHARGPLLDLAEGKLRESDTWPFTAGVAVHQGFIKTCQPWPVERPGTNPAGHLPDLPILLLNGDRDISTPMEWAHHEATLAPQGHLVIVKGESHSIQNRERGHAGRNAVARFLAQP